MFILHVCQALEAEKVTYAIAGGYAVALHGVVRGTVDVDIVIQWNLKNLQKAEKALKGLGLVSLLPLDAKNLYQFKDEYINNRNLIAWNFYHPLNPTQQVDLIIVYDLMGTKATKLIKTGAGTLRVLNLEELIRMKTHSGRPQDLEDVKALKQVAKER